MGSWRIASPSSSRGDDIQPVAGLLPALVVLVLGKQVNVDVQWLAIFGLLPRSRELMHRVARLVGAFTLHKLDRLLDCGDGFACQRLSRQVALRQTVFLCHVRAYGHLGSPYHAD